MKPRQARLGVDLFAVAMVASVGVALAGLSWRIAGDPGTGLAAVSATAPVAPPVDLSPVIALAPFGSAVVATGTGQSQDLVLKGIFQSIPRETSAALISVASGPARSYYPGQPVGAFVIDTVEQDHIVLRGPSGTQILAFPTRAGAAPSIVAASATAPAAAVPTAPPTGIDAIRALIPTGARGAAPPPTTAAPAARSGFLDSLAATPTASGYRIGSVSSPMAQAAGLRVGDVVERVNGTAVGDAVRDRQLFEGALASGSTRIDIVRDGRRTSLSLPAR